jgi:hypothetical protein
VQAKVRDYDQAVTRSKKTITYYNVTTTTTSAPGEQRHLRQVLQQRHLRLAFRQRPSLPCELDCSMPAFGTRILFNINDKCDGLIFELETKMIKN